MCQHGSGTGAVGRRVPGSRRGRRDDPVADALQHECGRSPAAISAGCRPETIHRIRSAMLVKAASGISAATAISAASAR